MTQDNDPFSTPSSSPSCSPTPSRTSSNCGCNVCPNGPSKLSAEHRLIYNKKGCVAHTHTYRITAGISLPLGFSTIPPMTGWTTHDDSSVCTSSTSTACGRASAETYSGNPDCPSDPDETCRKVSSAATKCLRCNVGRWDHDGDPTNDCLQCPVGWYQDETRRVSCKGCPPVVILQSTFLD